MNFVPPAHCRLNVFFRFIPSSDILIRLAPDRSLVPQSHARSSDEEEDSADSDVGTFSYLRDTLSLFYYIIRSSSFQAGGASRLLLAQSAPQKRRSGRNSRGSRTSGVGCVTSTSKRKTSRQPRARVSIALRLER